MERHLHQKSSMKLYASLGLYWRVAILGFGAKLHYAQKICGLKRHFKTSQGRDWMMR